MTPSRQIEGEQQDIDSCKDFKVGYLDRKTSLDTRGDVKNTELRLFGFFDYISKVGGVLMSLQVFTILSGMLLASYFKEEVSKIGKDILEVVSYENIYPLCQIMQAYRDRQSDVEHDKLPLILNPALTNEKPQEELEGESKDKTLATEQDKEVLKQLLSSN